MLSMVDGPSWAVLGRPGPAQGWPPGEAESGNCNSVTTVAFLRFPQKQSLRQGFESKKFIWEGVPGNPIEGVEKGWGKGKKKINVCQGAATIRHWSLSH